MGLGRVWCGCDVSALTCFAFVVALLLWSPPPWWGLSIMRQCEGVGPCCISPPVLQLWLWVALTSLCWCASDSGSDLDSALLVGLRYGVLALVGLNGVTAYTFRGALPMGIYSPVLGFLVAYCTFGVSFSGEFTVTPSQFSCCCCSGCVGTACAGASSLCFLGACCIGVLGPSMGAVAC